MEPITMAAAELAQRTADAYAVQYYGLRNWADCCFLLLAKGYSEQDAEQILRSKHMRWAADGSSDAFGSVSAATFALYLETQKPKLNA